MCGIFCACAPKSQNDVFLPIYEGVKPILNRRGPDYQGFETVSNGDHTLICAASVLWMQGKNLTQQPIVDDRSVFMYNGDIFGGMQLTDEGDTTILHNTLKKSVDTATLSKIQGPYSFIYFDKVNSNLYFCRDRFGRRSLLVCYKDDALIISSVAKRSLFHCIELPAIGIFTYNLKTKDFQLLPWEFKHSNFFDKLAELEKTLNKSVILLEEIKIEQTKFFTPSNANLGFFQQLAGHETNEVFRQILNNYEWSQNIQHLKQLLKKAIKGRVTNCCRDCLRNADNCKHCTVGVLFSGGIDCTVLALLLDEFVDEYRPIDLLNVAFDAKAPDRLTGLQTWQELKRLRPNRNWNFIELNVDRDELKEERQKFVADLIYPLNTVLDDSLGCALWFASRGKTDDYTSTCRALIVGMGADELFGGYTKHRASFKRSGWEGLHRSLEEDWQNISFRNLARDDRVTSDHGRQLRTPYLDENVVEFVRSLNCSQRTCPADYLPQGVGEKILLRSLAYDLGLKNAAAFKKKALQFGSRIANSKENAHEVSPRL